ncbi:MAG: enoyl-CoA hydratase-related protein [Gemmatimonadales bacterium]|jgi:2-(1,2-epoxy-1,2-dihydrophenyl)acetyl-CoA isomerase
MAGDQHRNIQVGTELGVGTLTLNRPEKQNALTAEMVEEAVAALRGLIAAPDVRAILITGAGHYFCAGADLDELKRILDEGDETLERRLVDGARALGTEIRAAPQPVLAAVNGVAAGWGASLALACDLRIAGDNAKIGQVLTKLGLSSDWGSTFYLTRLVGPAKAMELFISGDLIDAEEALRIGLVNKVVESHHLADVARSWSRHIAAAAPLAVHALKHLVYMSDYVSLDEMIDLELDAQLACLKSADVREGLDAFFGKRVPHFVGR